MAPPAEKKKKFSSADHRPISSEAIGEKQQQMLGSFVTSFGERQSLRVAAKKNKRILRKIWICTDVWMDTLPFFDRPQLGLNLALLSPRFEVLVDKHFDGKRELPIWRSITIRKDKVTAVPELRVFMDNANYVHFPLPDHSLPNKIRFDNLWIDYIDHSVIKFLRANQQIWDKGTILGFNIYDPHISYDQSIWKVFALEIWPIFAPNIRHFDFTYGYHLDNLRRHSSPTILTDLTQLDSIHSNHLLPAVIADDGPKATAAQALSKWLHTPTKDGKPKQLRCCGATSRTNKFVNDFKEAFLGATISSASYIIRIEYLKKTPIEPFKLMNERTNEMLTLEKEENNDESMDEEADDDEYANFDWLLKRCQIGKTIQWEDENLETLNDVNFTLYQFGPLSPPKSGQMNEKVI